MVLSALLLSRDSPVLSHLGFRLHEAATLFFPILPTGMTQLPYLSIFLLSRFILESNYAPPRTVASLEEESAVSLSGSSSSCGSNFSLSHVFPADRVFFFPFCDSPRSSVEKDSMDSTDLLFAFFTAQRTSFNEWTGLPPINSPLTMYREELTLFHLSPFFFHEEESFHPLLVSRYLSPITPEERG